MLKDLHQDGIGGELTQFGREGLVGSDGIVEVLSRHGFFVSFLVFKSFVLFFLYLLYHRFSILSRGFSNFFYFLF